MSINKEYQNKINYIKSKYKLLDFYDGFLNGIIEKTLNNKIINNEQNIDKIITENLKKEISSNIDIIIDKCIDLIKSPNNLIKLCNIFDEIGYESIELIKKINNTYPKEFDKSVEQIIDKNIESESKTLINFLTIYYSKNENEETEESIEELIDDNNDINYDPVKLYFREMSKYKVPTKEEEITLLTKYQKNNNINAKNELINRNQRLVIKIAKRYARFAESNSLMDVIMYGNLGLMTAIDRYDLNSGFKFATYATIWVKQAITRELSNTDSHIRIPIHVQENYKKIIKTIQKFESENSRTPTNEEISKITGLSVEQIKKYYEDGIFQNSVSLNQTIDDKEKTELANFIPDKKSVEEIVDQELDKDEITKLFNASKIDEREAKIISMRFGLLNGRIYSLEEIGDSMNLTRERVRQIEEKTLKALKKAAQGIKKNPNRNIKDNELFSKFHELKLSDEQIKTFFTNLDEYSLKILRKKYGKKYNLTINVYSSELKIHEKYIAERILTNINEIIKQKDFSKELLKFELFDFFDNDKLNNLIDNISKLNETDIKILMDICGRDLKNEIDFTTLDDKKITVLEKLLTKIQMLEPKNSKSVRYVELGNKNIYQEFEEYTKEQVDAAIKILPQKQLITLKNIYRNGIDNPPDIRSTIQSDKSKYYRLIASIKIRLEKVSERISIYEKYKAYTKEQVIDAIKQLSDDERKHLFQLYDKEKLTYIEENNLSVEEFNRSYQVVAKKLKEILKKYNKKDNNITLYNFFTNYTEEQINNAISKLSEEDIKLLKIKFGDNFKTYVSRPKELTKKQKGRIDYIRKKTLINILEGKEKTSSIRKAKSIYETLNNFSEKQIDIALEKLKKEDLELLHLRFGDDLKNPVINDNVSNNIKSKIYNIVQFKLRKIITNSETVEKDNGLYEKFSDFKEDEVNVIIKQLSKSDIELLKLRYGNDFKQYNTEINLSNTQKEYISYLIKVIRKKLKKTHTKTIYSIYKDYTKEEIDYAISILDQNKRKLLYEAFGKDLLIYLYNINTAKNKHDELYNIVYIEIDKILKETKDKDSNFYETFNINSKKELDKILNILEQNEIFLLKAIYGNDFKKYNYQIKLKNIYKFSKIKDKIRKNKLEEKHEKNLYELFNKYTKEQIDNVISMLDNIEIQTLKKRFGNNFLSNNIPSDISSKELNILDNLINNKIARLLEDKKIIAKRKIKTMSLYELLSEYSKEDIDKVLSKLSEKELNLLKLKYGNDLASINTIDNLSKETKSKIYVLVHYKIEKWLKNKDKKVRNTKLNLYERYSDYTKEQIEEAISKLDTNDLKLLKRRFGDNFKEYNKKLELTDKEIKRLSYITHVKIKTLLNKKIENSKKKTGKSLYESLSRYETKDIEEVLSKLNKANSELLKLRYGNDYKQYNTEINLTEQQKAKINQIKHNIKTKLERKYTIKTKQTKIKSIYEIYSSYAEEEITKAINTLDEKDLYLLHKRYGNDLKHVIGNNISNEDKQKIKAIIYQKLKRRLKQKNHISYDSLYDKYKKYTKEEIDKVIALLNQEDIELLKIKFGEYLTGNNEKKSLTTKQSKRIEYLVYTKIKKALANKELTISSKGNIKSLYEQLKAYSKKEIDEAILNLNEEDISMLQLKYGKDFNGLQVRPNITNKEHQKIYYIINKKIKQTIDNKRKGIAKNKIHKGLYEKYEGYTKEQVDDAISTLNNEDIALLKTKYGQDLTDYIPDNNLTKKQNKRVYHVVYRLIKDTLKNGDKKVNKDPKTLFELLKDYDQIKIKEVIESLKNEDKELLQLRYGKKYDEKPVDSNLTNEEINNIKNIIHKITSKLKRNVPSSKRKTQKKGLYEKYNDYTKEEIDNALNSLDIKDIQILKEKYGNDLGTYNNKYNLTQKENSRCNYLMAVRIKELLERKENKRVSSIKSIYDLLNEFTVIEIDEIIDTLDEKDINLLHFRYGQNLKKPTINPNITIEERKRINYIIYNNIKRKLLLKKEHKIKEKKSIYNLFKDYTKKEINEAIKQLNDEDILLLNKKYKTDFINDNITQFLSEDEKKRIRNILYKRIKKALESNKDLKKNENDDRIHAKTSGDNIDIITDEETFGLKETYYDNDIKIYDNTSKNNIINVPALHDIIKNYNEIDQEIIVFVLSGKKDIDVISKIYNVPKTKIIKMVSNTLESLKNKICTSFDEIIDNNAKQKKKTNH